MGNQIININLPIHENNFNPLFIESYQRNLFFTDEMFSKQLAKASQSPFLANTVFKTDELFSKQFAKASQSPTLANMFMNSLQNMFAKSGKKIGRNSGTKIFQYFVLTNQY
jgi:hypothetical protein